MAASGRNTPLQELQTAQLEQLSRKQQNRLTENTQVTVQNAHEVFEYLRTYKVLVCKVHCYAIGDLDEHLKRKHKTAAADRRAIVLRFVDCETVKPTQVPLPPPLEPPFDCLGVPKRAYICEEPECEELSINQDVIRIHCNKKHNWKSTPAQRTYWHEVWVQTFFNAAGLQRYFTVDYETGLSPRKRGGRVVILDTASNKFDSILAEWEETREEKLKALEVADREVAKTDHTLWFKRNEWPEHLAGSNLRHLSLAGRLPDKEERLLHQAVNVNRSLIETCVAGLRTLDGETRRWLRSAKLSEPDQRPLARLQNPESQQTYITYMSRLLCYSLRVLQSETDQSTGQDEGISSAGSGESDDESSTVVSVADGNSGSEVSTDVFKDARRLYPWHGRQRQLLERVQQSITHGWNDDAQKEALLKWYESIIFQKVRGDTFKSVMLHFLAVLGINEEEFRLRQANDFSYMLAGVVYCTRVLAVESILPLGERDEQDDEDDRRFRKVRDEYLADGTFSVMSKMLSLLAYGKSIALSHNNAGTMSFSLDRKTLHYREKIVDLMLFGKAVKNVITEAEDILWAELMWTIRDERFEIPLDKLSDDVTFTRRGVSFVTHERNGLSNTKAWMLEHSDVHREGRKLLRGESWVALEVKKYLRRVDRFRELLLFVVHITGGQPARGTEITSLRFRNGFMQDRNVFVIHGHMVVVTRYHKSQSQFDKPKVIPRFLPWRVGQLLAVYLSYVQPFQEFIREKVCKVDWSDYIWSNEFGPWGTDRLTKIIGRETEKGLGWRLTTLDYRHVAIALGREVIGDQFARGYAEQTDDVEEAEVEDDDGLEISAGRSGEIGANRYGVSLDVIKHLSSKSIDTFRPLSMQWHQFLGLVSCQKADVGRTDVSSTVTESPISTQQDGLRQTPAQRTRAQRTGTVGQKRGAHARSGSSSVGDDVHARERHFSLMLQNNGISGWSSMVNRFRREQAEGDGIAPGGDHSIGQGSPAPQGTPCLLSSPFVPQVDWDGVCSNTEGMSRAGSSPLWTRSHQIAAPARQRTQASAAEIKKAMQKALRCEDVAFRSEKQREALEAIISKDDYAPLVVVLPTGGGKSLLFTAPACLDNPGVTVVIVPYRALLNRLLQLAHEAGIDCFEWKRGEVNPAALVFVSADVVVPFMSYARTMEGKGLLRRVFVDESHLTFTASSWRAKLTTVRQVRGLRATTIMLTATLPPTLEFELEDSMAAQMARYVRMETTRARTRYTVDVCPVGSGKERVLEICERMKKHLGSKKGVVYSRSRDACVSLARELECAHYHAGQVDNQEQLDRWLERGGVIVATSALGTGVDFPGIEFIMHMDVPYGMIDFAQESGRGGRAGEDVDSVIVVEEGRVELLAELNRGASGIDQQVMDEFIATRGCRRLIMSRYLDGESTSCDTDSSLARCDRCGGGRTELERRQMKAARERQMVEDTLDILRDGCVQCWTLSGDSDESEWMHDGARRRERSREGDIESEQIKFAVNSHSCFRCGLSQRLCRTGQDESAACQWPGVMDGFAAAYRSSDLRDAALEELETGLEDWDKEYWGWMGRQHKRRIWDELMSNAMSVFIYHVTRRADRAARVRREFSSVERVRQREPQGDTGGGGEQSEEEMPVRRGRRRRHKRGMQNAEGTDNAEDNNGAGRSRAREFIRKLRTWEGVCLVCKAATGFEARRHRTEDCSRDEEAKAMIREGIRQVSAMQEPVSEQGRCWVGWQRCEISRQYEDDRTCNWSRLARVVAITVLYAGTNAEEAQALVTDDERFLAEVSEDGIGALERFFKQRVDWDGIESNMLCEMIVRYG